MGTIIVVLIFSAAVAAVAWSLYKTFSDKNDRYGCNTHCGKKLCGYTH